jgi:hypothetical protein
MPIDAFIIFKHRLEHIDYTDVFGERTEQLKAIRKDAFKELAKRLNSDVLPTDLEKEHEAAFFKEFKKKVGVQENKIGFYWENRIQPKRLGSMYNAWTDTILARVSDWNEFLTNCKSSEEALSGADKLPLSKDLTDLAKEISDKALEILALSSNYSGARDKIASLFRDMKTFNQIIEEDLAIYDSSANVIEKWKEIRAEKAQAALVAEEGASLLGRGKALAFGGVHWVKNLFGISPETTS